MAAAALAAVLVAGSMAAAYISRDQVKALKTEKARTVEASLDAQRRAVDAYIAQADAGRFSHRPGQRFATLEAVAEAGRLLDKLGPDDPAAFRRDVLRDLAIAALALPDIRPSRIAAAAPEGATGHFEIDPAFGRFVAVDHAGRCTLHRMSDGAVLARFDNAGPSPRAWPTFAPDGRSLAIVYEDGRLRLWRVDGAEPSLAADEPEGSANTRSLNFRGDGAEVLFSTAAGGLAVLDVKTGRKRLLPREPGNAYAAAYRPDGRGLVAVIDEGGTRTAKVRTLDDPTPIATLDVPTLIGHAAWSPDGRRIALAGADSRIYLWEPGRPGAKPLILSGLNNEGLTIGFNHRGDLLASNGWEGVLRLWDPRNGRQLLSVQSDAYPRFSADDRHLGLCRSGRSLQTFEVASGARCARCRGTRRPIGCCKSCPSTPTGASWSRGRGDARSSGIRSASSCSPTWRISAGPACSSRPTARC